MKAAIRRRWGRARDVVEVADIAKPEPADDEVLVHVHASSINRSDYYMLGGAAVLMRPMIGGFRRPKDARIGGDFAGIAEAVGKDVNDIQPGDEVYGSRSGAFAQYVASKQAVALKPANLSFEEAAAVPVAALTALEALRDYGKLEPGQRVLVNGASGGVGNFAVQLAKALGASHVTAVCSTRNLEAARRAGADRVVDYTREDLRAVGDTFDLFFDNAGSLSLRDSRRLVADGGTYAMVTSPKSTWLHPLPRMLSVPFVFAFGGRTAPAFKVASRSRSDLELLIDLVAQGKVKPEMDRRWSLDDAAEALRVQGEFHARGK